MSPESIPSWFSDADLIAKLTAVEDQFVERKSKNDAGGWLRTVVAFANSTPLGYPAVLFIGVSNAGEIFDGTNVENVMKSFADIITNGAYPPIYTAPHVLTYGGRSCIAVIIPGSVNRPHFAGRSYVRKGTQTEDASEVQFQELVSQRLSKPRELLLWKGKVVTFEFVVVRNGVRAAISSFGGTVVDCNQFYVTIQKDETQTYSYALADIEITFDHIATRLKLQQLQ